MSHSCSSFLRATDWERLRHGKPRRLSDVKVVSSTAYCLAVVWVRRASKVVRLLQQEVDAQRPRTGRALRRRTYLRQPTRARNAVAAALAVWAADTNLPQLGPVLMSLALRMVIFGLVYASAWIALPGGISAFRNIVEGISELRRLRSPEGRGRDSDRCPIHDLTSGTLQ